MDNKQIKELMAAMGRYGTKRLVFKQDGVELELEQEGNEAPSPAVYHAPVAYPPPQHPPSRLETAFSHGGEISSTTPPIEGKSKKEEGGTYVESPMVGTFYSSPSPEAPPFVKVGDRVEKETVVGIVEAMKVMNEVKANVSGTIVAQKTHNGDPVEVGTPLFQVSEG